MYFIIYLVLFIVNYLCNSIDFLGYLIIKEFYLIK